MVVPSPRSGVLALALALAGCNLGGPSQADIVKVFGDRDISDVSCVAASGQPGYVCSFKNGRDVLTRRFVKNGDGTWDVVH
jgi:hypothetical protein